MSEARDVPKIPVELQARILSFAVASAQEDEHLLSRPRQRGFNTLLGPFEVPTSEDPPAVQERLRSPTLFPFNAAYVCKLWRDMLSHFPECWKRVVFDLARDPSPILGAFRWSEPIGFHQLHVLVYNSSDAEHMDVTLERNRVESIRKAFESHVHRCASITFDIIYSSALPPPAMFFVRSARALTDLTLQCRVDDLDPTTLEEPPQIIPLEKSVGMNQLVKLSLTAAGFISLITGLDFHGFPYTEDNVKIHVTRFAFPRKGPYSLEKFAHCLARAPSGSSGLYLYDLSLAYDYSPTDAQPVEGRLTIDGSCDFTRVSEGVLHQLFTLADLCSDTQDLRFEDCTLPDNLPTHDRFQLELRKYGEDSTGRSEFRDRAAKAFKAWPGQSINFVNCPAFNNDFLRWWAVEHDVAESEGGPESTTVKTLLLSGVNDVYIHDCDKFSPAVLRNSLASRWKIAKRQSSAGGTKELEVPALESDFEDNPKRIKMIDDLIVVGNVPALTEEDQEWFKQNASQLRVTWNVGEGDYADFEIGRPPPMYYNPYKPWDSDSD